MKRSHYQDSIGVHEHDEPSEEEERERSRGRRRSGDGKVERTGERHGEGGGKGQKRRPTWIGEEEENMEDLCRPERLLMTPRH